MGPQRRRHPLASYQARLAPERRTASQGRAPVRLPCGCYESPMNMNRRTLVRAAVGVALVGFAGVDPIAAASATPAEAELAKLLQRLAEEYLQRSPEEATQYDYDKGANAALRSRLDDRSLNAVARDREAATRALADLARIDRSKLGSAAQLDYDTAVFVYS